MQFFFITLAAKSEDEIKTSAFDAAFYGSTGHILGLWALLGQNMVNVYKGPFFKVVLKDLF